MFSKKIIFSCTALIIIQINAITVISLGQACTVAGAMREYGIRITAYPFDWIVSPFQGLYQALSDNFEHFLQEDSLTIRSYDRYGVVDYCGFEFVHDFPVMQPNDEFAELIGEGHVTGGVLRDDWRSFLPQVKTKYKRRIDRLHDTFSTAQEKIYLIRYGGISREQAIQLRDLLYKRYPQLDFELIVLAHSSDMKNKWDLKNIQNFYLDEKEPQQWKELFTSLGF